MNKPASKPVFGDSPHGGATNTANAPHLTSSDVLWCNAWLLLEYTQRKNNNKETDEDYSL